MFVAMDSSAAARSTRRSNKDTWPGSRWWISAYRLPTPSPTRTRAGVIHRDLKGANVMIGTDGRVKVLDFGLAVRTTDGLTEVTRSRDPGDSRIAGTLAYMAPEVLRAEGPATASRILALGVVLHHMAAGQRPFTGLTGFDLPFRQSCATHRAFSPPPSPLRWPRSSDDAWPRVRRRGTPAWTKCGRHSRWRASPSVRQSFRPLTLHPRALRACGRSRWWPRLLSRSSPPSRLARPCAPCGPGRNGAARAPVVLPFENLSGDASQSFFSEG